MAVTAEWLVFGDMGGSCRPKAGVDTLGLGTPYPTFRGRWHRSAAGSTCPVHTASKPTAAQLGIRVQQYPTLTVASVHPRIRLPGEGCRHSIRRHRH